MLTLYWPGGGFNGTMPLFKWKGFKSEIFHAENIQGEIFQAEIIQGRKYRSAKSFK